MQPELGILADDLTGATDTGLQFAKRGRRTCISLTWPADPSCDVLVVDADTRHRPVAEARERVTSATRALLESGVQGIYKKVDSTGRGNIGGEIEATLEAYGAAGALICPAFPALGRTVRGGQIFVSGTQLDQTDFASDPLWPASTASLVVILRRQTSLPTDLLSLDEVRRGPAHVGALIGDFVERGRRLIVADAENGRDLGCLAEALRQTSLRLLPVGSAGLAEWLVGSLPRPGRAPTMVSIGPGPILTVSGTVNQLGIEQLGRLQAASAALVSLSCVLALDDPIAAARAVASAISVRMRSAARVVIALVDPRQEALDLAEALAVRRLSSAEATERLTGSLALAAEHAMEEVTPGALILTGGDTARGVCARAGIGALEVCREAAPGVPICRPQGGSWDGLPVVTKAGGFGEADTLVRVTEVLEGLRT